MALFCDQLLLPDESRLPPPYGVAVSGGGDSMALLSLLLEKYDASQLLVVHFNHNLRKNSQDDEIFVKKHCEDRSVPCVSTVWEKECIKGNLQQAARRARYDFFAQTCREKRLAGVFVGHTQDDVVETLLMRLARGSGLKGLAAMKSAGQVHNVMVFRPMLDFTREELREYLRERKLKWLEDPANNNNKFFRSRIRKAKEMIENTGISFTSVAASATALQRASHALEEITLAALKLYRGRSGELHRNFLEEPEELQLRLLEKSLLEAVPAPMAPRTSKLQRALSAMRGGKLPYTLGGVMITRREDTFLFWPENNAKALAPDPGES